ncbi:MAG: hypothetical protein R2821_06675 [Flavobacteriaceae bacterium]
MQKQFEDLYKLAEKTDRSFLGAVKAQEVKQLKRIGHIRKALVESSNES